MSDVKVFIHFLILHFLYQMGFCCMGVLHNASGMMIRVFHNFEWTLSAIYTTED